VRHVDVLHHVAERLGEAARKVTELGVLLDIAVMGEAVEERGRHLGLAEHARPLAEGEVGGDDDRGLLVEPADQAEEELPVRLREG